MVPLNREQVGLQTAVNNQTFASFCTGARRVTISVKSHINKGKKTRRPVVRPARKEDAGGVQKVKSFHMLGREFPSRGKLFPDKRAGRPVGTENCSGSRGLWIYPAASPGADWSGLRGYRKQDCPFLFQNPGTGPRRTKTRAIRKAIAGCSPGL